MGVEKYVGGGCIWVKVFDDVFGVGCYGVVLYVSGLFFVES